jgi:hypothetical protein
MKGKSAPIKASNKNLSAVKTAVQRVATEHPWAIEAMGGVTTLSSVILGAISTAGITVQEAAAATESALETVIVLTMKMMSKQMGLAECRQALLKILQRLA